jgi:hypothetical protein
MFDNLTLLMVSNNTLYKIIYEISEQCAYL